MTRLRKEESSDYLEAKSDSIFKSMAKHKSLFCFVLFCFVLDRENELSSPTYILSLELSLSSWPMAAFPSQLAVASS